MCRMLGVMCNDEDLLTCAVHEVRDALRQKTTDHDGIGVGYYRNDDPLLKKQPSHKAQAIDFNNLVDGIVSNVLLVHVRKATVGDWKDTNTHPFRFRRWLFAHVGTLDGLENQREKALQTLPPFLRRNICGETDSEIMFHLFLHVLYQTNKLDDLGLSAAGLGEIMQACIEHVDKLIDNGTNLPNFAIFATNGQVMASICRGTPVFYSHREGILECPLHDKNDQQTHLHRRFRGIMLGAEMSNPGHQWREVTGESLLTISRELELKVQQL